MDSMLGLGIALVGVFVALHVITLIIIVSRFIKMPLWSPLLIPIQRSMVEDALPVLDTAQPTLIESGFRYMHTRRGRSLLAAEGMPASYCDVYYHPEHGVHAEVYLSSPPTPTRICDIYLWNTFVDGTALLTVNDAAHALLPYPRKVRVADGYAADFAGHLATHLKERLSMQANRTEPVDSLDIAKSIAANLLSQLEKEKQVYRRGGPDGDPIYGFRFFTALKAAWRLRLAALRPKKKKPAGGTAPVAQDFGPAMAVAERIAFVRTLCMLRGMRAPRWFGRAVFAFSAVVFLALGVWWWGLAGAVAIAAVILVHEAGHWLAMKLAGFRDVQVFFVPGLGAATSGEKHEANPLTHLMVYLAGPVPGLLLSLAVFAGVAFGPGQTNDTWYPVLLTGAVVAFVINLFNLLPVLPLDGGRVVELFMVSRLPWLRFIFAVGSGGLLLAAGLSSGDNVTRVIGFMMLFGSLQHFRIAKASSKLLREKLVTPAKEVRFSVAAKQLHDFLAQADFQKWSFNTRLTVGLGLLPRFRGRLPSWKESTLGMTIYVVCALLPLVVIFGLLLMSPTKMMDAVSQGTAPIFSGSEKVADPGRDPQAAKNLEAERAKMLKAARAQRETDLAAAPDQTQRWLVLKDLINQANDQYDYEDALRLAKLFYAETGTSPANTRQRAEAAIALASAIGFTNEKPESVTTEIKRLQKEAEAILRQRLAAKSDEDESVMLGELLQSRTYDVDDAIALSIQQEIVTLYVANMDKSDYRLANARRYLALALDRTGQPEAAEKQMETALADIQASPQNVAKNLAKDLQRDTWWMLIAHRKLEEAERLLRAQLAVSYTMITHYDQKDARFAMLALTRTKADWKGARDQAIAIREIKPPKVGSWFIDLYLSRTTPSHDHRATLLLIEAERALGHASEADDLVAELRKPALPRTQGTAPKNNCRTQVTDNAWRRDFQQALVDIEKRELKCSPRKEIAIPASR